MIKRIPDREKSITDSFNLKLSCPYLNKRIVKSAEMFTVEERIGNIGKVVLRNIATQFGLPEEIVNRKKKAC